MGGSRDLLLFVDEVEMAVRLEGAAEVAGVMLGVMVIDELREVTEVGLRLPGRKVPPSEEEDASFWDDEDVEPELSCRR